MDVYHKVLVKIYEMTGGKETENVDLKDLLKAEGFLSNLDSIFKHLSTESWVTETAKQHVVRVTHWGVAEAKRVLSDTPDIALAITKDANRLIADSREFVIMLEEFAAASSREKFQTIEKRFAEMTSAVARIKENV